MRYVWNCGNNESLVCIRWFFWTSRRMSFTLLVITTFFLLSFEHGEYLGNVSNAYIINVWFGNILRMTFGCGFVSDIIFTLPFFKSQYYKCTIVTEPTQTLRVILEIFHIIRYYCISF